MSKVSKYIKNAYKKYSFDGLSLKSWVKDTIASTRGNGPLAEAAKEWLNNKRKQR